MTLEIGSGSQLGKKWGDLGPIGEGKGDIGPRGAS